MTRLSDDAVEILRGMARGGVTGNALGDLLDEVAALRKALNRIVSVLDVDDDDAEDFDTAVEAITVVIGIANEALRGER